MLESLLWTFLFSMGPSIAWSLGSLEGKEVRSDATEAKRWRCLHRLLWFCDTACVPGFGSMLRALGAQIEKTTNREACRDLSGRRLRDVNHEKE